MAETTKEPPLAGLGHDEVGGNRGSIVDRALERLPRASGGERGPFGRRFGRAKKSPAGYAGFISYSHAVDGELAPALQRGLRRFAKPWYRRRGLRIFRDRTNLSASPALWPAIAEALDESEWLILMASPEAAVSPWVDREVEHWCGLGRGDHALVVVTGGSVRWSDADAVDWSVTDALPPSAERLFAVEPRLVDLRWAADERDISLDNVRFRAAVADVAAALHGKPKDDLLGDDVREHRRTRRIAWAAVVSLVALLAATVAGLVIARQQTERAETNSAHALARQAVVLTGQQPALAVAVAAEAIALRNTPETASALQTAYTAYLRQPWRLAKTYPSDGRMTRFALGEDGLRLMTVQFGDDGSAGGVGKPSAVRLVDAAGGIAAEFEASIETRLWPQVEFSPDGAHVATIGDDGLVVWDASNGTVRSTRPIHDGRSAQMEFSADGSRLAVRSVQSRTAQGITLYSFYILDSETGREVYKKLISREGSPLAFSADNTSVAFAGFGGAVDVRDASSGDVRLTLSGHAGFIHTTAFSPDGNLIATAGSDRVIRLWSTADGSETGVLRGHSNDVYDVAFSPDGLRLVSGGVDRTVRIWDVTSATEIATLFGHDSAVQEVAFIDGTGVVSQSIDDTIKLWENDRTRSRTELIEFDNQSAEITSVTFSPDGSTVAAGADGNVALWDTHSGELVDEFVFDVRVVAVSFDAKGVRIATAPHDDAVVVVNAVDRDVVATVDARTNSFAERWLLSSVVFSPDGGSFATQRSTAFADSSAFESETAVWTTDDGAQLFALRRLPMALALSSDGAMLAEADNTGRVTVWNVSDATVVAMLTDLPAFATALAFTGDTTHLAVATDDQQVTIWDVTTGLQETTLVGPAENVDALAFSSTGMLAMGARDGTVIVQSLILSAAEGCAAVAASVTAAELENALGRKPRVCTGRPETGDLP